MTTLSRRLRYALWLLNGYVGMPVASHIPQTATVLITYFHPMRMRTIDIQVRNILKCRFVSRLVISNHNPDVRIEDRVKLRDKRLIFVNQLVQRGCGHRWNIAREFDSEYLIVVDDDLWFFPSQLARLFVHLVNQPEVPHGIAGMVQLEHGGWEYHDQREMVVDYLCEAYAVTRCHLQRYVELRERVATSSSRSRMIDEAVDFMLISQAGSRKPEIHNVGRLFRSLSFKQEGVAVHKRNGFSEYVLEISRALRSN